MSLINTISNLPLIQLFHALPPNQADQLTVAYIIPIEESYAFEHVTYSPSTEENVTITVHIMPLEGSQDNHFGSYTFAHGVSGYVTVQVVGGSDKKKEPKSRMNYNDADTKSVVS